MNRLLISLFFWISCHIFAQPLEHTSLEQQIRSADSLLFEAGFNRCELDKLKPIIDQELVFYHDQSGISQGSEQFFAITRANICGNPNYKPIRKAIEGSFEIFPLYNNGELYGALHSGRHAFFIQKPDHPIFKTSEAKFTHLWLKRGNTWVLKQVYSFDHTTPD